MTLLRRKFCGRVMTVVALACLAIGAGLGVWTWRLDVAERGRD